MNPVLGELIYYLESNLSIFLKEWQKNVIDSEDDLYKDEVALNGLTMFEMVKSSIIHPIDNKAIKKLADKVAEERAQANINIGEFVYNVNLCRSEIFKYIYNSGLSIECLEPVFNDVNRIFDNFTYYGVTKYTELKDQLLQEKIHYIDQSHQERLTILGQMASTFVHEFRNPLTAILGFVKLISNDYPDIKYLDIISHELNQLNYKISQFLHVSKKDLIEKSEKTVLLYEMFIDIIDFLYASLLDGEVEVINDIDMKLEILVNKEEIRQVILNILLNSIDALKQLKENRRIWIQSNMTDGNIEISISNNGPKIQQEFMDTIFEPFYTTKEFGTGIGLFVCKKIIEKHGGTITCVSDSSQTIFKIVLPLRIAVEA
ncbi:sensor histidine kinase [Ferdinandcohnia quinoae]|uniref:histidine kinase n=1 Tax=Fredinandcohnia quinoae TaxID=2918902 RepID=A0AAW5EC19_9BACI|nr:HAMP domain-containing sensor histidine kinase [Fredinandcohnia sp. SECRCQ15]MCH1626319.1 HAMP domain-containing histidine kinase [Fredinandcohnia sp. SECRCQ15]